MKTLLLVILMLAAAVMNGCSQSTEPASQAAANSRNANVTDPSDEAFQQGVDRPPTAKTMYMLSRMMISEGKDAQAEAMLKKIIAGEPGFMVAYTQLAQLQLRNLRVDDAIMTLSAGLKQSPRDAVLNNDMGMCYMIKQQWQEAQEYFASAAGVDGANARYAANLAAAIGMLGRYDECLAVYQQVLPEAEAHANLAVIAEARDDTERAWKEKLAASALASASKASRIPTTEASR